MTVADVFRDLNTYNKEYHCPTCKKETESEVTEYYTHICNVCETEFETTDV